MEHPTLELSIWVALCAAEHRTRMAIMHCLTMMMKMRSRVNVQLPARQEPMLTEKR